MAARKRESVAPSASSESQMTYSRFLELFPDSDACLEYLKNRYYPDGGECPKCGKQTKFHRIKSRAAYSCQYCRLQVYPTSGTIFHKSTTSLQLWFWAIYLMSSTRCGISAKQLEREIGVTYKTAHRMFKQIRTLLADDDKPLSGEVEIDETGIGGRPRRKGSASQGARHREAKPTVLGMVERGGRVRARVVGGRRGPALIDPVRHHVLPASTIFTDEWRPYKPLGREYAAHHRINHSAGVYVDGNVHTNTIEGFFGLLKNGIRGVYHAVSREYLQSYLDEYTFRYNQRDSAQPMFWAILDRVRKISAA
jgi:ISXO2-like transposase domain/Transposase zinc-ribbon domain